MPSAMTPAAAPFCTGLHLVSILCLPAISHAKGMCCIIIPRFYCNRLFFLRRICNFHPHSSAITTFFFFFFISSAPPLLSTTVFNLCMCHLHVLMARIAIALICVLPPHFILCTHHSRTIFAPPQTHIHTAHTLFRTLNSR